MNIDIVNLIENNPIIKLNGNYQSKLIEKIKNKFNNYEQQLFVASFYCFLNYDYENDYVIDLDDVWKWLEFSQKDAAKRVLNKNFIIEKDYKILLHKLEEQKNNKKGGHNKEIIMLNIDTFKRFCLKAGTKKADEVHNYFIKLEKILQEVLQEETNELKIQLENKNNELEILEEKKNKEYEDKLFIEKILEREKVLLKEYADIGSIVYIIKVKTFENKSYIIKIGESRKGITYRYNEHKSKYDECLLLDCFAIQKNKDFESFLHNHEQIRCNRVNNLEGHEKELELFLIGKNLSYSTLLNIINNNIKYFNSNDTNYLELEIKKLKLMIQMKDTKNDNLLIEELVNTVKGLSSKIDNLEKTNKEILNNLKISNIKITSGFQEPLETIGPRLQKINPETFELIRVYENASEIMKENHRIKRPSLNNAIIQNTIYLGYRWLFVDRELDPNIIHKILPNKNTKIQNIGYIAKINKEKTEILNIYIDRKTAAKLNGYISPSALDITIKKYSIKDGYYYKLYNECEEDLKFNFENKYGKPLLYKNGIGQFDINNNLITEFICKYDCIRMLHISDKTLSKALDNNKMYNNFYFKYLESKIKYL